MMKSLLYILVQTILCVQSNEGTRGSDREIENTMRRGRARENSQWLQTANENREKSMLLSISLEASFFVRLSFHQLSSVWISLTPNWRQAS